MRTAVIHNLSVEDHALLRQLRKSLTMSAPLADREILRAGLRALSEPCQECESLRQELAEATKPKKTRRRKKKDVETLPAETPETPED